MLYAAYFFAFGNFKQFEIIGIFHHKKNAENATEQYLKDKEWIGQDETLHGFTKTTQMWDYVIERYSIMDDFKTGKMKTREQLTKEKSSKHKM